MNGAQWKPNSGYAGTLSSSDWSIGAVDSVGFLYLTNAAHDVGWTNLVAPRSTSYLVNPAIIGDVGTASWKIVAP